MNPERPDARRAGRKPGHLGDDRWADAVRPPWERPRLATGVGPLASFGDTSGPRNGGHRGGTAHGAAGDGGHRGEAGAGGGAGHGGDWGIGGGSGGSGGHRRYRWRRRRVALAAALALLFAACTSAGALLWYGQASLEQSAIEGITPKQDKRTVTLPGGEVIEIMNVLLVGTDNPDSLTPEQRELVAPDERSGRRPDTLMLAQIEVGGSGAALLSIPRDLRVELCDGSTNKINAAYAAAPRAGQSPESCLVTTVSRVTGIEIDHFVEVDFGGFLGVVDALGGVTMYFEEPMVDSKAHLNVPAGCVTLTPEQALGFVRSRGYDDDFGRIARQQRFVKEVVDEVTRVGTLANPRRLVALVERASKAVRTDDQLSLGAMRDLALGGRNLTSSSVITHTLPATPAMIDGVSYVIAEDTQAEPLYQSFRDGSVLRPVEGGAEVGPQPEADPEPTPLAPAEVAPIVVLNGTEIPGLAAAAAAMLEAHGFRVVEIADAPGKPVAASHVLHGSGLEDQAAVLAAVFDGADVRTDPGRPSLTLVLGTDVDLAVIDALMPAEPQDGDGPQPAPAPQGESGADEHDGVPDRDEPDPAADDPGPDRTYRGTERTQERC